MDQDRDNPLFETPKGVRIRDVHETPDPDATVLLSAGDLEESEQLLAGFDPEASIRHTRAPEAALPAAEEAAPAKARFRAGPVRRRRRARRGLGLAAGPGARFVYGLLMMTVTLGAMGLALSWQHQAAMMVAGIFCLASGILAWVFWRSWLDGLPYCYRLLTSLGEDAENLLHWRLFRRIGAAARSLYR